MSYSDTDNSIPALETEAYSKAAKVYTITIPAGAEFPLDIRGQAYFVIASNAQSPLLIGTDKTSPIPQAAGTGSNFPKYFRYYTLSVKNPNSYAVRAVIWAGFGEYIDRRTYFTAAPCKLVAVNISGAFTAGTTYTLTGVPPSSNIVSRKSVIVTNRDSTNWLSVYDESDVISAYIPPSSIIEIESQGVIKIKNTNPSDIAGALSEQWNYLQ